MARAERIEQRDEERRAKRRKKKREGKVMSGIKLKRATGLVRVELVWKEAVPEHSRSELVYCQINIEMERSERTVVGQLNPGRLSLGEKRKNQGTETTERRDEREEGRGRRAKGPRRMYLVLGFCFEADGIWEDWRLATNWNSAQEEVAAY
jgi:hypothetical protein